MIDCASTSLLSPLQGWENGEADKPGPPARARVLGTRRSYRGEKSPTEAVMPTVVVGQSGTREGTDERAEDKRTTAGTRTGSEAAGVGELASNGKTRRSS